MPTALAEFNLNERQERFVTLLVRGADLVRAASDAGYGEFDARRLLRLPHVAAAVEHALRRALLTEDAPLALQTLRTIMKDEKSGAPSRVAAAKIMLDRAGIVPPVADKGDGPERQLADMTAGELKTFIDKHEGEIDRLEGELAARATPVNTPDSAPIVGDVPIKGAAFLE